MSSAGRADVVQFSNHVAGALYVTCDLLGRPEQAANRLGAYELAICDRTGETWPAELICKLAYYTLEAHLEAGDTMDIGPRVPAPSRLAGLLFDEFARFSFAGEPAGVLLCIGITAEDLAACRCGRRDRVIKALKAKSVDPFTDLKRRSALSLF